MHVQDLLCLECESRTFVERFLTETRFNMLKAKFEARGYHLKLDMTSTAASLKPVTYKAAAIASAHDNFVGLPASTHSISVYLANLHQ